MVGRDPRPRWLQVGRAWLYPRGRRLGGWAFILNRLSGLVLTAYLLLHLTLLSTLAWSPAAYDWFIELMSSRLVLLFDLALAAVLIYHGLNGIRLTLVGLGVGVTRHKEIFWAAMLVGLLLLGYGGYRLWGGM